MAEQCPLSWDRWFPIRQVPTVWDSWVSEAAYIIIFKNSGNKIQIPTGMREMKMENKLWEFLIKLSKTGNDDR